MAGILYCLRGKKLYRKMTGDKIVEEKLKNNPEISAEGVNIFKAGFSEENLDLHWTGGDSDHSREYLSYSKEQYAKEALDLIQSATNDTILGYKNRYNQVVRYDKLKNNYVKGHPDIGIATMFKPDDGLSYFENLKRIEAVKEDSL